MLKPGQGRSNAPVQRRGADRYGGGHHDWGTYERREYSAEYSGDGGEAPLRRPTVARQRSSDNIAFDAAPPTTPPRATRQPSPAAATTAGAHTATPAVQATPVAQAAPAAPAAPAVPAPTAPAMPAAGEDPKIALVRLQLAERFGLTNVDDATIAKELQAQQGHIGRAVNKLRQQAAAAAEAQAAAAQVQIIQPASPQGRPLHGRPVASASPTSTLRAKGTSPGGSASRGSPSGRSRGAR